MSKETVAVLFGGRSVEHEVSVITGHQVMDALEAAGYACLPIYITKEGEWYVGHSLYNIKQYTDPAFSAKKLKDVYRMVLSPDRSIRKLLLHPDTRGGLFKKAPPVWADVFFPTIHGTFGEDGTLQGVFAMADVAYVGSNICASAIGMDKARTKIFCKNAGIPVLDCITISRADWKDDSDSFVARVEDFCGYPAIVKPICLGSSIGVKRCERSTDLTKAIEEALLLDDHVLVERAITNFIEINCSVIGPPEQASVCEQPCTSEMILSFDDKYRGGGKGVMATGAEAGMASQERIVPAPISAELTAHTQELSIQVFRLIGASGIARVDFLLDTTSDSLYFNEINTMPGSLAFYLWEAVGLPFDELVAKLVNIALEQHRIRCGTQFSFEANLLRRR